MPLYRTWTLSLASRWRPRPVRPARSANRSRTIQPTLCRVPAYWLPGFPSPTTSFTMRLNPPAHTANGPGTASDGAHAHGTAARRRGAPRLAATGPQRA